MDCSDVAAYPLCSFKPLERNIFKRFTQISNRIGHCGKGTESWMGSREVWAPSPMWELGHVPSPNPVCFAHSRTLIVATYHCTLHTSAKHVSSQQMLMTLFIIVPKCTQSKCPSTGDWINKWHRVHMVEYYSAIKKNDVLIHITAWMNLEYIMLNEKYRCKKPHIIWLYLY